MRSMTMTATFMPLMIDAVAHWMWVLAVAVAGVQVIVLTVGLGAWAMRPGHGGSAGEMA